MGTEHVRYGIIGTGMMGLEHIRNLGAIEGARVVAVSDPHGPSLAAAQATVERSAGGLGDHAPSDGVLHTFSDHRDLLAADLCDAIVIASPNMTHAAILPDVLDAGLHVLVEKPLCTTVADCRHMVEAAGRGPKAQVVWVGLEYRYMPPVARLIDEVRGGTVGRAHMVAIREHRFPFLTKVGDWNRFNRNTGGTLVEKCCHFFDLMNLLFEATPTRVMASGSQSVNHLDEAYDGERPDILDNAMVIVEYGGDRRASLDLCMFAEASRESEEISVVGDRGKVEAFLPSGRFRSGLRSAGPAGVEEAIVHDDRVLHEGFHHGASYLEHVGFLDAIRAGGQPDVTLADGLLSVAVGVAAQRSIERCAPVTLDEVLAG